jgi:surface protein
MDDSVSNHHPSRESEATNDVANNADNAGTSPSVASSTSTSESNDRHEHPRCSVPRTVSVAGLSALQQDKSSPNSGPAARSGNAGGILLVTGGAGDYRDASLSAPTSSTLSTGETHNEDSSSSEDPSSAVDVNSEGEESGVSRELESPDQRIPLDPAAEQLSDLLDPPAEQLPARVISAVIATQAARTAETVASVTSVDDPSELVRAAEDTIDREVAEGWTADSASQTRGTTRGQTAPPDRVEGMAAAIEADLPVTRIPDDSETAAHTGLGVTTSKHKQENTAARSSGIESMSSTKETEATGRQIEQGVGFTDLVPAQTMGNFPQPKDRIGSAHTRHVVSPSIRSVRDSHGASIGREGDVGSSIVSDDDDEEEEEEEEAMPIPMAASINFESGKSAPDRARRGTGSDQTLEATLGCKTVTNTGKTQQNREVEDGANANEAEDGFGIYNDNDAEQASANILDLVGGADEGEEENQKTRSKADVAATKVAEIPDDDPDSKSITDPPSLLVATSSGGIVSDISMASADTGPEKPDGERDEIVAPEPVLRRGMMLQREVTPGAFSISGRDSYLALPDLEVETSADDGEEGADGICSGIPLPAWLRQQSSQAESEAGTYRSTSAVSYIAPELDPSAPETTVLQAELVDDRARESQLRHLQQVNQSLRQQLRAARGGMSVTAAEAVVVAHELHPEDNHPRGTTGLPWKCFPIWPRWIWALAGLIVTGAVVAGVIVGTQSTESESRETISRIEPSTFPSPAPSTFDTVPSAPLLPDTPSGQVPTPTPDTRQPSLRPSSSIAPSAVPTPDEPSVSLELVPSVSLVPTVLSSDAPTIAASKAPSLSKSPSFGPTTDPSSQPSPFPTQSAQPSPTIPTTRSPTSSSVPSPGLTPRLSPKPTPKTTSKPTKEPTTKPTPVPEPTLLPTRKPTVTPTTAEPTDQPTFEPTKARVCFEKSSVLQQAVKEYILAPEENSEVARTYGWPIGTWCVSAVNDFSDMFSFTTSFNEDLSGWDMSSATSLNGMFSTALKFNQDLSSWDVSNVEDMGSMFWNAREFDGDLSLWDVSKVKAFDGMFNFAYKFNQDVSAWNVGSATDMNVMFSLAFRFNQDLSGWDISSVTDLSAMLFTASAFNQDLCDWGPKLVDKNPNTDFLFTWSACDEQSRPDLDRNPPGPFCYTCPAREVATNPNNSTNSTIPYGGE